MRFPILFRTSMSEFLLDLSFIKSYLNQNDIYDSLYAKVFLDFQ